MLFASDKMELEPFAIVFIIDFWKCDPCFENSLYSYQQEYKGFSFKLTGFRLLVDWLIGLVFRIRKAFSISLEMYSLRRKQAFLLM